ncbi:MAG: hypothetical protein OJF49_002228 [Ktedonobacterales bacterium]|nr:MAG: hypothetical protein OJF49_002228 [Ktedonobacterales bacterium]
MRRTTFRDVRAARRRRADSSAGGRWAALARYLRGAAPRGSALWWLSATLSLLLAATALSAASPAPASGASLAAARASVLRMRAAPPTALPVVARWTDATNGTAYSVQLTDVANLKPGGITRAQFTFTTPKGDQLAGVLLVAQLTDNSYVQSVGEAFSAARITCAKGVLATSGSGGQTIVYTFAAHFDQYALVAYAHLAYASAQDDKGISAVCGGQTGQPGETELDMLSGCDATTCTSPLDTAGPTVASYDAAMITAARGGGPAAWGPVYNASSQTLRGQYGADQFASVMSALVNKNGRITAITPVGGAPQTEFDAAGQGYFTITETVTVDHGGGKTTTATVTSYYLLEGGRWAFWFSQPAA